MPEVRLQCAARPAVGRGAAVPLTRREVWCPIPSRGAKETVLRIVLKCIVLLLIETALWKNEFKLFLTRFFNIQCRTELYFKEIICFHVDFKINYRVKTISSFFCSYIVPTVCITVAYFGPSTVITLKMFDTFEIQRSFLGKLQQPLLRGRTDSTG